jgi:serine/threonine-protein kinase
MRGVSPLTLAILFFAIVVPMPPRRMAVAATVATLTDPLALGMTFAFGNPVVPTSFWLWLFLPNAIVVGLAVAAARVVYGLGQTVHQVRKMGRYRLVEKLGEGGMGEVWRAEHAKLARPAAVKLIRPNVVGGTNTGGSNDNKAVQRFKREAHATAMLSSPHTVELYDFGVNDDGAFYYVMELLDGMDLETLLDHTKALDPERVVHLLLGLCHSLRDAHQSGVVHRDIKPANIYVCKKGGDVDFVKLLDFGLARRVATDKTESRLTFAGDVIGTPQYIAPESLSGEEVDGRADLYALGCVAYRMLAGRDVFTVSGIMPLLFAHVEKKPTPLGEIRPDIPPELTRIVMRCLAKSPAERPPSSAALMQELQETGLAERWTPKRARAWWNAQRKKQELAVAPTITGSEAIANAETIESS